MKRTLITISLIISAGFILFFIFRSNNQELQNNIDDNYDTNKTVSLPYPIVDTDIQDFYSNDNQIEEPMPNEDFYGQDAHYQGNQPSYADNGDGTITDNITGLMWQKDMGSKMTYVEALKKTRNLNLAGYEDWRIPSIKELYSLILFTGSSGGETSVKLYIDTNYFTQPLGDTSKGEREIDAQTWSSTEYVSKTMNNIDTIFGVNFVDGRIKGYPKYDSRTNQDKKMYFRFVRGNKEYGENNFINNEDDTISDLSTNLMWQRSDDGIARNWQESLDYCNNLKLGKYNNWRLPNAKELQSIVDYSRSPKTTQSAAIDPMFNVTEIKDPNNNQQFPYFWTSTTHLDGANPYDSAVYIAFGEAQGKMNNMLMDVHGAGAQRSDPKTGIKNNYPTYFGPQGDVRYVYNYVRCVRNID